MSPAQVRESSLSRQELEKLHKKMLKEVRLSGRRAAEDEHRRREFDKRFDRLVEQFRLFAKQVSCEEEFHWLTTAAREWEEAYFSVFREPRHLRAEIGISVPPRRLEPAYNPLADDEVCTYLSAKANDVSQARKLTQLFRRWAELKSHPDRIHSEVPSADHEMKEDWYWASVFFATEVLEGTIRFAHRISEDCFALLESVWVEDVKRLKAYLLWEKDGSHWKPDGGKEYFFQAADLLRRTALETGLKASCASFVRVERYLEQSYLSDGVIDPDRDPSAHCLIVGKAQRIWERSGRRRDAAANWADAQRYVKDFYEHIIPAAKEADPAHVARVAEAFRSVHRGKTPCDIVNCLEAVLLIYYVDPAVLTDACGSELNLLF